MAAWVTLKARTYLFVLCDYGCTRLDGMEGSGGLDGSGAPGHVEEENLLACPV
jgi:hypothetical protein